MPVARCAAHLGANLAERPVLDEGDGLGIDRLVKRRPAAVAVKLGAGCEQFGAAPSARVEACAFFVEEFAGEGAFRTCFAKHVELLGAEN